jgi:hypothetical protein
MKADIFLDKGGIRINENLKLFEAPVSEFLFLEENNVILVLLDYKRVNSKDNNLLCLDEFGEMIWRIKSREYPDGPSRISSLYMVEKSFFIYRYCGIEEEVEIRDGSVISSELIK